MAATKIKDLAKKKSAATDMDTSNTGSGALIIHFLDVGQGDGTFIIFPDGSNMLVDLGSKMNKKEAGGDAVLFITNTLGDRKFIDILIITHGDGDHYNLLPELHKKGVKFGTIYAGGPSNKYRSEDIKGFLKKHEDIVTHYEKPYWTERENPKKVGDVSMWILAACILGNDPDQKKRDNKNQQSIVIMLEYAGNKIILTGDAEWPVEKSIMSNYGLFDVDGNYNGDNFLRSTALKLGHHGSKAATRAPWIQAVSPNLIFASADRKFSHPYEEVIDRFRKDNSKEFSDKNTILYSEHNSPGGNPVQGNSDYEFSFASHQYVCGVSKDTNYNKFETTAAVYTNLFDFQEDIETKEYIVYGTQYELAFAGDGGWSVKCVDSAEGFAPSNDPGDKSEDIGPPQM